MAKVIITHNDGTKTIKDFENVMEAFEYQRNELKKAKRSKYYCVEVKADKFEWGAIAEVATIEQAEKEIAHQQEMDKVQEEENEYRIVEID
jgi:hypothetical protein